MAKKEAKAAEAKKSDKLYISFYENADGKGILTEKGNSYICSYGKDDAVFIPKSIVKTRNKGPKGKFIEGNQEFFDTFNLTKLGKPGPDGKRVAVPEGERETITLSQLKESVDAQNAERSAANKAKLDAARKEAEAAEAEAGAEMDGPEA